jgi:predicted SAM-dependent methyltransferase
MLGVNVGSGQRKFYSIGNTVWLNADCQEKWLPDVVASGDSMPMFRDGEADYVVLHHVLEHFGCGEATSLIRECHRILKPFGSLLVFVPDLAELASMWQEGRIDTQVYATNLYGAYMNDEADRHKWGYDAASLKQFLLTCADWTSYYRFNWRPIEGANLARDRWILGVEAIK